MLIDAFAETREGVPSYTFEYTIQKDGTTNSEGVRKGGFFQHSISVVMSRGTELFTLTGVAPESKWLEQQKDIKTIAKSFKIAGTFIPEGFY